MLRVLIKTNYLEGVYAIFPETSTIQVSPIELLTLVQFVAEVNALARGNSGHLLTQRVPVEMRKPGRDVPRVQIRGSTVVMTIVNVCFHLFYFIA